MALDPKHRRAIDAFLQVRQIEEADEPKITLAVTKRQLKFILEAIAFFRESRCPLEGKGDECAHLAWAEGTPDGAIERVCVGDCSGLLEAVIAERLAAETRPTGAQA